MGDDAELKFDPEKLRPAELACEPDPRSRGWVKIDSATRAAHPITLADHHEAVARFVLHANVPQDIVIQFETAKNVYLYAWFIYRFYNVAEHQSFACLELALRYRLKQEIAAGKVGMRRPTLRRLLKYAVESGLVKNEEFSNWRSRAEMRSRSRVEMEKLREMAEKNLTEISWDESEVEIKPEDFDWNYAKTLADIIPKLRNSYAHGSTTLHNWTLNMIQTVCEIINQLYPKPG